MTLKGHFIPTEQGNVFVTQFGDFSGDIAVLCLPPLFEELNLSRAVLAKQAHHFANNNLPCFILDYFGTGDSEGDLEQTNTTIWLTNVISAGKWLEQQGIKKIILWGVRFGGLLALANQALLIKELPIVHQLHWKPLLNGKQYLSQFLRIKKTNEMMQKHDLVGNEKINWREHILSGNTVEVAGYPLTTELFNQIEKLAVSNDFKPLSPITWCELASASASPVLEKLLTDIDSSQVKIHCLASQLFWQTPEIFDAPELIKKTYEILIAELDGQ